jgi:hypothetical protein
VDLQLELQNKTDMIRNKYYDVARDLLAKDSYRNLHSRDINQLDSNTEEEEQSLHDNIQNNNNDNSPTYSDMENTSILFGDMEINLDKFYGDTKLEIMSNIEEERRDREVDKIVVQHTLS